MQAGHQISVGLLVLALLDLRHALNGPGLRLLGCFPNLSIIT